MWSGQESVKAQIRAMANTAFLRYLHSERPNTHWLTGWKFTELIPPKPPPSHSAAQRPAQVTFAWARQPAQPKTSWLPPSRRSPPPHLHSLPTDPSAWMRASLKEQHAKQLLTSETFPLWSEGGNRVGPSALQQKWIFQFQLVLLWINKQMNNWREKHK